MSTTTQTKIAGNVSADEETDLPEGWAACVLGNIVSTLVDGSHNPPPKQTNGTPMLSARNIENNRLVMDEFRFIGTADFKAEHARTNVAPGDVLLTIVGSIGRSLVVPDDSEPFALQRSVAVVRPSSINSKFVSYQFSSTEGTTFF
jgi:type I restriction enzyme S subunit